MSVLTVDDFLPKKGDDFQLVFDEGPALEVALVEITSKTIRDFPGKIREPFSLFFEGTRGVLCPQGNYRIRHASGWETVMFIVPIGDKPDGSYRYQAVFN